MFDEFAFDNQELKTQLITQMTERKKEKPNVDSCGINFCTLKTRHSNRIFLLLTLLLVCS